MRQTPARTDVLPPCLPLPQFPALKPLAAIHRAVRRTVRRVVRHKAVTPQPSQAGLRAAEPGPVGSRPLACGRAETGPAPAARAAGRPAAFGKAFDPDALKAAGGPGPADGPQGDEGFWTLLSQTGDGEPGVITGSPGAVLLATILLASGGGVAIGAGLRHLERSGAFTVAGSAPHPAPMTALPRTALPQTASSSGPVADLSPPVPLPAADRLPGVSAGHPAPDSAATPAPTAEAVDQDRSDSPGPLAATLPGTAGAATPHAVPEPASLPILGLGGLAAILAHRRARRPGLR